VSIGEPSKYARAWAEHRRRKRLGLVLAIALGAMPSLVGVVFMLYDYATANDPLFGIFLYIIVCAVILIAGSLLALIASLVTTVLCMHGFRCPRCGERFSKLLFEGPTCQHCALPIRAEGELASPPVYCASPQSRHNHAEPTA
jgi:hypothetical protein